MTRAEAIKWLQQIKDYDLDYDCMFDGEARFDSLDMAIQALENVRVKGEWLNTTHGIKCSACDTLQTYASRYFNYCPICGADMRGDSDER